MLISKEGQLANRIWHLSYFIANAREYGFKLVSLFFNEYYEFYSESLSAHRPYIRIVGKHKNIFIYIFQRMVVLLGIFLLKIKVKRLSFFEIIRHNKFQQLQGSFNLNDQNFIRKAKSKLVLVRGWNFKDTRHLEKYRDLIKRIWTPNEKYLQNVEQYYKKYKQDHDLLIGVHIRRGDYFKFNNGVWHYELADYYNKMKELSELECFEERKIAFVICSDEKEINFNAGGNFHIFFENRHFIEDLYLLAKCDYIIGPPSTYSLWASFYGSRPLYMIKDITHKCSLSDFKINKTGETPEHKTIIAGT